MRRESAEELLNLVDRFEQHLAVLKRLGEDTLAWSSLLVFQLSIRLHPNTLREWENHCVRLDSDNVAAVLGGTAEGDEDDDDEDLPSYVRMVNYLQNYARVLQSVGPFRDRDAKSKPVRSAVHVSSPPVSSIPKSPRTCAKCHQDHFLYQCPDFNKLSENQRLEFAKNLKLCLNCLRKVDHFAKACPWKTCNRCSKKHHTLLHGANFALPTSSGSQPSRPVAMVAQPSSPPQTSRAPSLQDSRSSSSSTLSAQSQPPFAYTDLNVAMMTCDTVKVPNTVILPTALVEIEGNYGSKVLARCLLDSGSQSNFMTSALCQELHLSRTNAPSPVVISGIGQATIKSNQMVSAKLSSLTSAFSVEPQFLVLPSLAVKLPVSTISIQEWPIPPRVTLADPAFFVSQKVDIILGAEYFFDIRYGRIQLGEKLPSLQNTVLGWIVSGACPVADHDHADPRACFTTHTARIEELLQKFWELETVRDTKPWSPEEKYCEQHFIDNTIRNEEGRYVVRLPKREELLLQLRDNQVQAAKRFYSLERSLQANPEKKVLYHNFIQQYLGMGHMREVSSQELCQRPQFFLPHHGVLKMDSAATKLRTVFDGSCKSSSGISLNDVLLASPTIQDALVEIVVRFRMHRFVIAADIEKMFRQILVHPDDQPLSRIWFRFDSEHPLKAYQLVTVTYGLNNSPFLATRVLKQLSEDEQENFPLAAPIARKDFYMDNLLSGCSDETELMTILSQMIELLRAGGFPLRQWSSNCQAVLDVIPEELRETRTLLELDENNPISALGLLWEPASDKLAFKLPNLKENAPLTKRTVLSQMSSLFDPLGLLGPAIVRAKILMQSLWKQHLDWDAPLPEGFRKDWQEFQDSIPFIRDFKVSRAVVKYPYHRLELHGFSDASELAYGACIYLRSVDENNKCTVELLIAKSRVAPINSKSVPRLELSAALLLAHLLELVSKSTSLSVPVYLWTDSTVVLSWLAAPPSTWKTFVANRVAEIQEITSSAVWNHVSSEDNPADMISRGVNLRDLTECTFWWHGPRWLRLLSLPWPDKYVVNIEQSEELEPRKTVALPIIAESEDIIDRYSQLGRLLRVCAWGHRFRENTRREVTDRVTGPLSSAEIDRALVGLVRRVQEEHFGPEIAQLEQGLPVGKKSKLRFLKPSLVQGVIRVGGRLHHSALSVDEKHPIVLPAKHHLTWLIATSEHARTLHGGPNLLLSSLRQRFWPLNGRNLARSVVHQCVTCARARPRLLEQMMGDLPPVRVNRSFPFDNVGVDFAGPLYVRHSSRKAASIKVYVAVYVCLGIKAVHLDLVPDLTTEGFVASLRRFVGRRGKPHHIYCDNGRNFVGAQRELGELRRLFLSQAHKDAVTKECTDGGIEFHFIPPRSPSMGGIWEAAVKSMKFHLRRVVGNALLTETELRTVLIQIEAMLNSRPISPMSEDPQDLEPLTPGHFLVGRPLNAIPEPDLGNVSEKRLSRWQRVQNLSQHFWRRWSRDYLSNLQNRYRWTEVSANLVKNTIVLLQDENLPPQKWAIGRIVEVHPGKDGLVRVVSVRTAAGVTQRAVSRLCLLPVEIDAELATAPLSVVSRTAPDEEE
ncbi:uncharacterized protein LOC134286149 [Aedes albopictus]|uniref:Integrase catalytic domain-containing protein n=1 Tax=Aedes albopictus TaxID=7160 RepID=A0ABM1Z5M0_AEDAL